MSPAFAHNCGGRPGQSHVVSALDCASAGGGRSATRPYSSREPHNQRDYIRLPRAADLRSLTWYDGLSKRTVLCARSSVDRAPASGAGGRWFDTSRAYHFCTPTRTNSRSCFLPRCNAKSNRGPHCLSAARWRAFRSTPLAALKPKWRGAWTTCPARRLCGTNRCDCPGAIEASTFHLRGNMTLSRELETFSEVIIVQPL
jgi:hypothetical protein